jgi:hypothetical protein
MFTICMLIFLHSLQHLEEPSALIDRICVGFYKWFPGLELFSNLFDLPCWCQSLENLKECLIMSNKSLRLLAA